MVKSVEELFTHNFLVDLLCTASYGSSWFAFGTHKDTPDEIYQSAKDCYDCREDIWSYVLMNGGYLLVEDVEEEKDYRLTLQDIINGFKITMLNYPEQYAAIMTENADLYDADCVIQCAVFGELTYG